MKFKNLLALLGLAGILVGGAVGCSRKAPEQKVEITKRVTIESVIAEREERGETEWGPRGWGPYEIIDVRENTGKFTYLLTNDNCGVVILDSDKHYEKGSVVKVIYSDTGLPYLADLVNKEQ